MAGEGVFRVGIIGPACRDLTSLPAKLFEQMIGSATRHLQSLGVPFNQMHLVSGGSSGADQVAVRLFLTGNFASLTLHLPAVWDEKQKAFTDNGQRHWQTNPGRLLNSYHKTFSQVLGSNTLDEIAVARDRGARFYYHAGFHARNAAIATGVSYLLAFSWAEGEEPRTGGTVDTWNKCRTRRYHLSLLTLGH